MSSSQRILFTTVAIRGAAALLVTLPPAAMADEFMAYPGLWKTTTQPTVTADRKASVPQPDWHCVDEAEDPWSAYARIVLPEDDSCTQTQSDRTATSLEWTVECKGPAAITSRGKIIFDSPSHYRGEVQLSGNFMGNPVNDKIALEGQRFAACTSPSD
jgi:hypothetical protein